MQQLKFLHPKYWSIWLLLASMTLITRLPYGIQLQVGSLIGHLGYLFAKRRRHIAKVNIDLCFQHLSESEKHNLVRDTFRSTGIGLIETANSWLRTPSRFNKRFTINGLDNLKHAVASGKGVLLVGMHASTLDLCGAVLSSHVGFDIMYRPNKNLLIESIMTKSRERNFPNAIQRNDIRRVLKSLKKGHAVWYGPDQDYGIKHSVFAPFFGNNAATITATARFARISHAEVIFFSHYRQGQNYIINLSKPAVGFPTKNDLADATYINKHIEKSILEAPDQYWWIHRRFKTQPQGLERPY